MKSVRERVSASVELGAADKVIVGQFQLMIEPKN